MLKYIEKLVEFVLKLLSKKMLTIPFIIFTIIIVIAISFCIVGVPLWIRWYRTLTPDVPKLVFSMEEGKEDFPIGQEVYEGVIWREGFRQIEFCINNTSDTKDIKNVNLSLEFGGIIEYRKVLVEEHVTNARIDNLGAPRGRKPLTVVENGKTLTRITYENFKTNVLPIRADLIQGKGVLMILLVVNLGEEAKKMYLARPDFILKGAKREEIENSFETARLDGDYVYSIDNEEKKEEIKGIVFHPISDEYINRNEKTSQLIVKNRINNADRLLEKNMWGDALKEYQSILTTTSEVKNPLDYAHIKNNEGICYFNLALISNNKEENITKAILACEEALKIRTVEKYPLDYAQTQGNLGNAYCTLAEVRDKEENATRAIKVLEEALKIFTVEKYPYQHKTVMTNIEIAKQKMK